MTRYYFHIEGSHGVRRDEVGAELPDLPSILREALARARALARDAVPAGDAATFRIVSEAGLFVLVLSAEALLATPEEMLLGS